MGKAPTYTYFTRALNTHRTIIDQDVHRSGAEPVRFGKFNNQKRGKAMPRTFAIKRPNFNTYSVTMGEPGAAAVSQTPFKNTSMQNNYKKPSPPNFVNKQNTNNYRNNFSSNYTPLNKGRGAQASRGMRRNFGPNRTYSSNTSSQFNRNRTFGRPTTNFNQRRGAGNFRQGTQNNNKCSLCGYSNHKATDCRNIRDDGGNIKQIIPTMGTCTECPKHIFPRLHHPPTYCPFRTGTGIFSKRN
jgi:hypothetical protein